MKYAKIVFAILLLGVFSCTNDPGKDGADATSNIVQVDGYNSLITITDEELGENCEAGGKRIDTGLDNGDSGGIAGDGILQPSEIDQTEYVCNGVNGADGIAGIDGQDGIDGINAEDGSNGIDGQDGNDGSDSTSDIAIVYDLSGNIQKGPCFKDSEILIQPLDPVTMNQIGTHFIGFTKNDFGYYDIPAEILNLYAEVFFEGECHNEITGGFGSQRLSGIIKVTDLVNNINPLTKIRSIVAREIFSDNIDTALLSAEILILNYLGMPSLDKRFTEMNLEEGGIHDAVLALTNSMILYGRSEAEQSDYIVEIANGIINNDLLLKFEIADTVAILPLIQIKNNLESRYSELGMNINVPPIWRLGAPDYYADLLERDPITISIFNLTDNTNCSFDQSTYNTFAIPHIFDSAIETSRYIASNFPPDAEISIWSKGTHINGYIAPGIKMLDITALREIILDNPIRLSYNGFLGDSHGLTAGTEYYMRIRKDNDFTLSTGCEGGFLPFGRKLASDDEGLNWIGHDNNTPWFRKSGIKMFTTN